MKVFPSSAFVQLEFTRIKELLSEHCKTEYAKTRVETLELHTHKEVIDIQLRQGFEFKQLLLNSIYFPSDYQSNISRELKLLTIPGAVLAGDQVLELRKLSEIIGNIFRWFDAERSKAYPGLMRIISGTYYEKKIVEMIDRVIDENGQVKDNASSELREIRMNLYRKRNELRRVFDKIISRLNKQGYLADIEESFLNGRRVVAVFAEQKRMVKGILHGESESRRTTFIEPEETIGLNNEIFSFEADEAKEVYRILRELTASLSAFAGLLFDYYTIIGEFDFIRAKARLSIDIKGEYPVIMEKAHVHLVSAFHPLLYLYNQKSNKPTIPTTLTLDERNRILVISGPNAGGKTVTLKTVGLLQMMVQAGLLVPVHPSSEFGIFKQIMIHIGDTQSLEFELSTYSSHLKNMKYFIEEANGKTLFFIDELGSGSDPNLGGAFAEVILEELTRKHALGIVTTHYLNLKVMANKTPGIINGAMAFDENRLQPLYQLIIGKPGSSYTFSIAERIGLDKNLIERARKMVDEEHFRLDRLLNRTEQDLRDLEEKQNELQQLVKENEKLRKEMKQVIEKERHKQQIELLSQQNKITEERINYLKETERKLKQILVDYKKEKDKNRFISDMDTLLFRKGEKKSAGKLKKKFESKYEEVEGDIKPGDTVKMKKSHQVGKVIEIRGKRAVVKIGQLPIQVEIKELVAVVEKSQGGSVRGKGAQGKG